MLMLPDAAHRSPSTVGLRALVALAVLATMFVGVPSDAAAQAGTRTIEVWGLTDACEPSCVVPNPKDWKYRQSVAGDDLGSATAADPALDDSSWDTVELRWEEFPGSDNANHFRKDFNLASLGVQPFQVVGIRVRMQYDDTVVMYLNGTEVYRSIRGNLDPGYDLYAEGADIPHDVAVPWGGAEDYYIDIPDPNLTNLCEIPDEACSASPYPTLAHPPAVPESLLLAGNNTWAMTIWNNSNGGSGDVSVDHVFELVVDDNAIPPANVEINETMASNDGAYQVQLDEDPELETPDWFELRNLDAVNPTDISGWTIGDDTTAWVFPAGTVIPPGGYMVVAANDGDDPTTTPMQTNFKLSSGGDSLKLTTDGGVVADEYFWTDQFTDNSFGRPGDVGDPTYLVAPTPGATNNVGPLASAAPILRFFRDRMFNPGEPVDFDIDAFDPDGDDLSYGLAPMPTGVTFDSLLGVMGGTFDHPFDLTSTITVTDGDLDVATQDFEWFAVPAAAGSPPMVLNEYNAVPATGELNGGSVIGNGGDWFEFVVIEDDVDLRGYSIEFRQRDADTDQLRFQTIVTFSDAVELGRVPAGTIITISEDNPDDLSFDASGDWSINLQITNLGEGTFFDPAPPGSIFNSTRRDQTVLIRNPSGVVVAPLTGETDAWDAVNGGVSGGEVMNNCRDLVPDDTIDPLTDYRDNGSQSTFGADNVCVYPDPLDPGTLITDPQDLSALRSSAALGAGTGDVTCDLVTNIVDALFIARLEVGLSNDTGPCLLDQGGAGHEAAEIAGDVSGDGETNIVDALFIARCEVGLPSPFCPD